jgi:hypothetical protein
MKKYTFIALGVILEQLFFVTVSISQATVNNWTVIAGGGGVSTTPGFMLTSSIGQPFAGKSSNITTTVVSGFLGYVYSGNEIVSSVQNRESPTVRLKQNYPNPFRSSTTISWFLPSTDRVVLKIFDFLGHEVITLRDEEMSAGDHEMQYRGEDLPDGIYILHMETGNFSASELMQKIK